MAAITLATRSGGDVQRQQQRQQPRDARSFPVRGVEQRHPYRTGRAGFLGGPATTAPSGSAASSRAKSGPATVICTDAL
ncbi:MAG: hypothetical protein L0Y54_24190, partial [Sporichthyaceae bacterium]|nr:hypothetical protein [Sporichthyaceae bacterium]